jgi:hypothetical protein
LSLAVAVAVAQFMKAAAAVLVDYFILHRNLFQQTQTLLSALVAQVEQAALADQLATILNLEL